VIMISARPRSPSAHNNPARNGAHSARHAHRNTFIWSLPSSVCCPSRYGAWLTASGSLASLNLELPLRKPHVYVIVYWRLRFGPNHTAGPRLTIPSRSGG
jgi:hypothetical protein